LSGEMLRVLVVDDEPPARDKIREVLEGLPGVSIVGEAGDGLTAAQAIQELRPDLVFLDVRMPELDGFGVLAALPEGCFPLVVFVTAFDAYAARAFDLHAVDYVLKPFDRERFSQAVARARERLRSAQAREEQERVLALVEALAARRPALERVLVRTGARFELVRLAEVDWLEAAGNYVALHLGRRTPLLRRTLGGLEQQLDPGRFRRIHRSLIVNLDRVKEVRPDAGGEYQAVLLDGTVLRVSRSYRENLLGDRSPA
jgi:two-component system LytT family response regulator